MEKIVISTPLEETTVRSLKAGDSVLISGIIYTARDAAHKRLVAMIEKGEQLPFELKGSIIYYCGPTPPRPGKPIGSAGPTTSGRMDAYAPLLIKTAGVLGMIGKGRRNANVIDAIRNNCAIYFAAVGGAGALISQSVKKSEAIAFPELGPEAIYRLEVENFPAIVAIDYTGKDICR